MRVRGDTHKRPEEGILVRGTLKSTGVLFLEIFDEVEERLHAGNVGGEGDGRWDREKTTKSQRTRRISIKVSYVGCHL